VAAGAATAAAAASAAARPSAAAPAPALQMPSAAELDTTLARSDMVWAWSLASPESVPALWTEAPFVGNGMAGAYLTVLPKNGALHIEVSRADYWDVRLPGTKYYLDENYIDTPRLPGGFLTLTPPAGVTLTGGSARVHLYNASMQISLQATTAASGARHTLTFAAVALADKPSMPGSSAAARSHWTAAAWLSTTPQELRTAREAPTRPPTRPRPA
jgi:hypothetical protein